MGCVVPMKKTNPDRWWSLVAAAALVAVPLAHAQSQKMFKCLIDGRTVYQQTACPANAVDAKRSPDAASAAASAASQPAARVQAAAVPAAASGAASGAQR
jgi:hypothetical protein